MRLTYSRFALGVCQTGPFNLRGLSEVTFCLEIRPDEDAASLGKQLNRSAYLHDYAESLPNGSVILRALRTKLLRAVAPAGQRARG